MLADCYLQTGQDKELVSLLRPREQMFGGDLAFAYLLGTALLRMDDVVGGQKYVDRVFGAGESAEAHLLHGHRALRRSTTIARRRRSSSAPCKLNPKLPTANSLYGRALMRSASRTPPSARTGGSSSSTPTTSRPTCSSATCASPRSASPMPRPISSARR